MKRLAAALSMLALSGALVFPSAAAPFALIQSDAVTQDVSLAPAATPNGDYAYLDENDELVVDLTASNPNLAGDAEGVNPDGVTTISNVFRVHYNGSRYAHVWITDESDAVTFVVDGEPIQSEANNVTLGPNESVAVGVVVDTTGDGGDGLIDDMEVHAKTAESATADRVDGSDTGGGAASGVASTDADGETDDGADGSGDGGTATQVFAPSPTERSITVVNLPEGESTTVDLGAMPVGGDDRADPPANLTLDSITLVGDGGGVNAVVLAATQSDGPEAVGVESLGAVEVTESDGAVSGATLGFSVSAAYLDARGIAPDELVGYRESDGATTTLPVRVVGERDDGRVVFEVDTPGFSTFSVAALRPSIRVSDASLSADSIGANDTATVTARVTNDGRAAGERTVDVSLDGEVVAERVVDLEPNETTAVTVEVAPESPGSYAVAVDGTVAGTLAVTDGDSADGDSADGGGSTEGAPPEDDSGASDLVTSAPVEEPAGLGLPEIAGLAFAVALLAATLLLGRRVSS